MGCSVFAAYVNRETRAKMLYECFLASEERGRDSWGLWSYDLVNQDMKSSNSVVQKLEENFAPFNKRGPHVFIGHRRASPVSETFVLDKLDVQPHLAPGGWIISFNGIIANDKEVEKALGPNRKSFYTINQNPDLDSWILADAINKWGFKDAVKRIKGSFAIVAYNINQPWNMYFACNYRPLYIKAYEDGSFTIASQEHYLGRASLGYYLKVPVPQQIEPYTYGCIDMQTGFVEKESLYPLVTPRVLAVISGGLDSVTAAWSMMSKGYTVDFLHFQYRCKASQNELRCVQSLAKLAGSELYVIDTDFFSKYGKSSLTDETRDLTCDAQGESAAEYAHEWVPARNTIMASMALGLAEAKGYSIICLGNNLEESGSHPDNEMELYRGLNKYTAYMVKPDHEVKFEQPVGNLMKHEIALMALRLKVPLKHTWSCYTNKKYPCGSCGSCYNRKRAFQLINYLDPLFLHEFQNEFWQDCVYFEEGEE